MPNSSIFLVVGVLLAAVIGVLFLGVFSGSPSPAPQLIAIDEALLSLPDNLDVAAVNLFESATGTLALMRVKTAIPMHAHLASNEVIYVLSGEGNLVLGDPIEEVREGHLIISFFGLPMQIENTADTFLDLLAFLTPPSNEENVRRFESPERINIAGHEYIDPLVIDVAEQLENRMAHRVNIPVSMNLAGFESGALSLQRIYSRTQVAAKSDLMLYALNCKADLFGADIDGQWESGDLLIVPHGNKFRLTPEDEAPCDYISFELAVEDSAGN